MIPVRRVRQPRGFKAEVEDLGAPHVAEHLASGKELLKIWAYSSKRKYVDKLRGGFENRCGYSAIEDMVGTVDHFYSTENHPRLAYKWSNYRYSAGWLNSAKKPKHDGKWLDPYEVGADWFELSIPDMQLSLHLDRVPVELREKARFTFENLPIRHDERIIRLRTYIYGQFKNGELTMLGLAHKAPLIADAVRRFNTQRGQPEAARRGLPG